VFGDYVSIYDFQQSVEDGATVPLYYENRTPELRLENPNLNEDLYDLIEAATLDEDQEARLERELGRQYHLITRDDRLDTIAHDIVRHFLGRGFQGKAMVVSIGKATALRMYDKVRRFWQAEQARVEGEIKKLKGYKVKADPDQMRELEQQLYVLSSTDMAVIVSPGQNEIEDMRRLGLDIEPHRKRINSEPLDEKFKDPQDPLRLVFVCAMWLTGFDAPSCSTVYLDKPMRNHTLMQTIARANRVFPGKHNGLIVDYANVFASLEKALAIYGQGRNGALPVREKAQLLADLKQAVSETTEFCLRHHVSVAEIESSAAGSLERLKLLADAVNALISPDPVRKEFLASVRLVTTLYGAAKPDPAVLAFAGPVNCFVTLAGSIQTQQGVEPADISVIMSEINNLLDRSIAAEGFRIREAKPNENGGKRTIDLSAIDFEALAKRFAKSQNKSVELERLKAAIRAQIDKLIRFNRTRADYLEKFEALIETYNSGSRNIEELFQELLNLSRSLNSEQERHVRENLREEELTVFDLLTRPGPELGPEERDEVKKVTRQLLEKLRQLLVLDWRKRQSARAKVEGAIKDVLDQGLACIHFYLQTKPAAA